MRLIPGMGHRTPDPRKVHGTAGAGLVDATWAANPTVARIGRDGEIRTARLLNDHRPFNTAVLHDLAVPAAGYTANIDHAVVSGNRVLLIDTKAWRSGRYWTLLGVTRRGWRRFDHAGTRAPAMARDRIARMLAGLPQQQRAVVVLRYLDDLSEQATAAHLGISVGAVKSAASRGLATLRAHHVPEGEPR